MRIFTRVIKETLIFVTYLSFLTICNHAKADICWDYGMRYAHCGPGCEAEQTTSCGFGCISGDCVSDGGSGECCGEMYYSAVIYPDGGRCANCPQIRARKSTVSAENEVHVGSSRAIWWDTSRGLIKLSKNVSYRPPRQAFVLNKCSHAYGVLISKEYPVVVGDL